MDELSYDDVNWMSRYLKIVTKRGEIAPLRLNRAQMMVHNTLDLQRRANLPMRALILKARQEGVSTYTAGRYFKDTLQIPRCGAVICSADDDATDKVFKMIRFMKESLPEVLQRKTEFSNRKEIVWAAPHMGGVVAQTAGKGVLGRGGTTRRLHCSEIAFWNNASKQFLGLQQEVPNDPDTMIILESTANGVGGMFYDMYMQAIDDWDANEDLRNWLPVFLPWFIFPEYTCPLNGPFEIGRPHAEGFDWKWVEEEQELVSNYGLTLEQLMWRRLQIKMNCQGDLATFNQEYPSHPDVAFQTTGSPAFNHERLNYQGKMSRKEGRYGLFDDDGFHEVEQTFNAWKVLIPPQGGHEYTMGVDTMEGKPSDPNDVRSKLDFHGIAVFDRTTAEYVCIYEGRGSQRELAHQVNWCAQWYNDALTGPEIPNGLELLSVLKELGYENIYEAQRGEDTWEAESTENLGWRTTLTTRVWLVEGFRSALGENSIRLNFPEIIAQARSFVRNKQGKAIHASGKHDDLLFGAMIALQLHVRSPLSGRPYKYQTTAQAEGGRARSTDLALSGCIDPGPDEEDEDNGWFYTG